MLSTGDFGKMDVMCLRIEIVVIQLPCKGWACSVGDTKIFWFVFLKVKTGSGNTDKRIHKNNYT